ncbi:hypothetical protein K432DRAFT_313521, partial [Lepidopterella palustris CBS 459.81]
KSGIIQAAGDGKSKVEIAAEYRCSRHAIYSTVERWNQHHTLGSLPRSGVKEKLTRR